MAFSDWSGRLASIDATLLEVDALQASYYASTTAVQQALDTLVASISNAGLLVMLNTWRSSQSPFEAGFPGGALPFGTGVAILTGDPADDGYAIAAGTGRKVASLFPSEIPTLDLIPGAAADVSLHAHKLTHVGDAAAATDALNRETGDGRYVHQDGTGMPASVVSDTRGTTRVNALSGITPMMFGAVGDGTTDDTTAVQAAINQAPTYPLFIDRKYGVQCGALTVPSNSMIYGGSGKTADPNTVPQLKALGGSGVMLAKPGGATRVTCITIENLLIDMVNIGDHGIDFSSATVGDSNNLRLKNVSIGRIPVGSIGFQLSNCGDTILDSPITVCATPGSDYEACHWSNTDGNCVIIAPNFSRGLLNLSGQTVTIIGGALTGGLAVIAGQGIDALEVAGVYFNTNVTSNAIFDSSALNSSIRSACIHGSRLSSHNATSPLTGGTIFKGKYGMVELLGNNCISAGSTGGASLGQAFDAGLAAYAGTYAIFDVRGGIVTFVDGTTSGAFWNDPPNGLGRYHGFMANNTGANQLYEGWRT